MVGSLISKFFEEVDSPPDSAGTFGAAGPSNAVVTDPVEVVLVLTADETVLVAAADATAA
jgi:hypothetical protein